MDAKKIRIVVVDPLISGAYLADTLKRFSVETIVIYTLADALSEHERKVRIRPELFAQAIYFSPQTDDLSVLVEKVRALKVDYILYGCESTVDITDQLTHLLGVPYGNNPATSSERWDKYDMQEAVKKAHLPHIFQMKVLARTLSVQQMAELKAWHFPVIAKPSNGAVSIGVKVLASIDALKSYLKLAPEKSLAVNIEDYVVQELLIGDEYFVDTFSALKQHVVVSVQRYCKTSVNGHPIYRYVEMIDPSSVEYQVAREYVLKVLDAVELENGFSHTELCLTANGPRLIEVNPRISGALGFVNKLAEKTVGTSQPQVLAEFLKSGQLNLTPRKLQAYGRVVLLQNWLPRTIGEMDVKKLRQLASYVEHLVLYPAGSTLNAPVSLLDTVAYVLLVNADQAQLETDYAQLQQWEENHELF